MIPRNPARAPIRTELTGTLRAFNHGGILRGGEFNSLPRGEWT
jgi:hypothetical protein